MFRIILATTALAGLVACGDGNPFGTTIGGGTVGTSDSVIGGASLDEDLTANAVTYDDNGTATVADDTLIINNLPFDNSNVGDGDYTVRTSLPGGFDMYESPLSASGRQYFAVFRRSARSQAAAVATDDYVDFGFGGLLAERLGLGGVPAARSATYTFTGEYAGIRVYRGDGISDIAAVEGDAILYVDIVDFDTTGAVEGIITNRDLYSIQGVPGVLLANLDDYIYLATAQVDFANAQILQSTAGLQSGTNDLGDGDWSALFSGPAGEEIAGIVVVEGEPSDGEVTDLGLPTGTAVRENGVFIVLNGG